MDDYDNIDRYTYQDEYDNENQYEDDNYLDAGLGFNEMTQRTMEYGGVISSTQVADDKKISELIKRVDRLTRTDADFIKYNAERAIDYLSKREYGITGDLRDKGMLSSKSQGLKHGRYKSMLCIFLIIKYNEITDEKYREKILDVAGKMGLTPFDFVRYGKLLKENGIIKTIPKIKSWTYKKDIIKEDF